MNLDIISHANMVNFDQCHRNNYYHRQKHSFHQAPSLHCHGHRTQDNQTHDPLVVAHENINNVTGFEVKTVSDVSNLGIESLGNERVSDHSILCCECVWSYSANEEDKQPSSGDVNNEDSNQSENRCQYNAMPYMHTAIQATLVSHPERKELKMCLKIFLTIQKMLGNAYSG